MTPMRPYWSPYRAGVALGLTLLATYLLMGFGLGASGAFAQVAARLEEAVAPGRAHANPYLVGYLEAGRLWAQWIVVEMVGVIVGAVLGAANMTLSRVVIYDDTGGLHAARLFFTLDVFGHARASLLDGGIQAWQRAKLPLTTEIPRIARTDYRPRLRAELVVSAEWVRDRLTDPTVALVDARTPAEYAGKDVRAKRGGHIPGAVNIDWRENLRPDGTFKPVDELRRMYVAKAVTPDRTAVTYCQTHHRAAHSYFVLRLLGYPRVVGYDRSWIEWGNRDDLPIAQ